MSEQPEVIVPEETGKLFIANQKQEPVQLTKIMTDMGIMAPQRQAEDLIDRTFVITAAKSFRSAYEQQDHAYFCRCYILDTGEVFSVVLGGGAVVEMLDLYIQNGPKAPLQVTLRQVKGGRFGRYYVIE